MKDFEKAKWIWINDEDIPDEYAEFVFRFETAKDKKTSLKVAADSNYYVTVNGRFVSFGQYADYPDYKVYDDIDISEYCKEENEVRIFVWYYGEDSQTYIRDAAGVIFEVVSDGKLVAYSDSHILGRMCSEYENHYRKVITYQLGWTYKYYASRVGQGEFHPCTVREKSKNLHVRPIERLRLGERVPVDISKRGNRYLIDMREETVGFLTLELESEEEQEITVLYGEYLRDGHVNRTVNGKMNFCVEYVAKKGKNSYLNPFRRLAGRYMEVYTEKPIKLDYIGLSPVYYPLSAKPADFRSALRNKIYDVSVKTLHSCMHEHYEDCPWREQALYTMDSRNEMLCTYEAFGDFAFARSNLVLISKGLRADGLLTICYPSGLDFPIPSFSLAYFIETYEYVERSGDVSVLREVFPVLKRIADTFLQKIDENGLIAVFPYPYWNFYEWSEGSDNTDQITRKAEDPYVYKYDLILNCMFIYCMGRYQKLCEKVGESFFFDAQKMKKAIVDVFYDKEKGLFKAESVGEKYYTVLGNSFALLCGLGGKELADKLTEGKDLVPITLSMNTYLYEALLSIDKGYSEFILADIDRKYKKMLDLGATTFWETESGAASIEHTGSLCHGWSAMPIYYYRLLNGKEYFNGAL